MSDWRTVGQAPDRYCTSAPEVTLMRDGETVIHAHASRTGLITAEDGGEDRPVYRIRDTWREAPTGLHVLVGDRLVEVGEFRRGRDAAGRGRCSGNAG